jgi:hypothetical protein
MPKDELITSSHSQPHSLSLFMKAASQAPPSFVAGYAYGLSQVKRTKTSLHGVTRWTDDSPHSFPADIFLPLRCTCMCADGDQSISCGAGASTSSRPRAKSGRTRGKHSQVACLHVRKRFCLFFTTKSIATPLLYLTSEHKIIAATSAEMAYITKSMLIFHAIVRIEEPCPVSSTMISRSIIKHETRKETSPTMLLPHAYSLCAFESTGPYNFFRIMQARYIQSNSFSFIF